MKTLWYKQSISSVNVCTTTVWIVSLKFSMIFSIQSDLRYVIRMCTTIKGGRWCWMLFYRVQTSALRPREMSICPWTKFWSLCSRHYFQWILFPHQFHQDIATCFILLYWYLCEKKLCLNDVYFILWVFLMYLHKHDIKRVFIIPKIEHVYVNLLIWDLFAEWNQFRCMLANKS